MRRTAGAARSKHPGGVNAMMADGSLQFITDAIDQATWQAARDPGGKRAGYAAVLKFGRFRDFDRYILRAACGQENSWRMSRKALGGKTLELLFRLSIRGGGSGKWTILSYALPRENPRDRGRCRSYSAQA